MKCYPDSNAYPETHIYHWQGQEADGQKTDNVVPRYHGGLTKREYFAGLAMQGILASHQIIVVEDREKLGVVCVKYADALIDELSK